MDDDAPALSTLDAYAVLGVGPDVTPRDLRRAYRRALLEAHPDQGGTREALEQVRAAHDLLRSAAEPSTPIATPPAPATEPAVTIEPAGAPGDEVAPGEETARLERREPVVVAAAPTPRPMAGAAARATDRFATAQRFATTAPAAETDRPRRARPRRRGRFEQLLERELLRRTDRRVRLVGADHAGGRA